MAVRIPLLALPWVASVLVVPGSTGNGIRLNPEPASPLGNITGGPILSPDSRWALYRADQDTWTVKELYSVELDPPFRVHKLNGPMSGEATLWFQVSPDSRRVIYVASEESPTTLEVYSAPIDGSAPRVKLNGTMVGGGNVNGNLIVVTPDSTRVLYVADQDTDGVNELYSAPIDGSTPAVKLNAPLVPGGGVIGRFQVSPDSTHAVYVADQEQDEVRGLYSVPVDGSAAPVRLNADLPAGGYIPLSVAIGPDSSAVFYRAEQAADDVMELWRVPLDGSAPPARLNGSLVSGGGVYEFTLTPDGSHCLYKADQLVDDVFELFSVPTGGGPPVRLNGSLVAGGDVSTQLTWPFATLSLASISPDSSRVLYVADQDTDGVDELYTVPVDGSQPAVRLNAPLAPDEGVVGGSAVNSVSVAAFLVDEGSPSVRNLYIAPLDASSAAVRVNPDLVAPEKVRFADLLEHRPAFVYGVLRSFDNRVHLVSTTSSIHPEGIELVHTGRLVDYRVTPDETKVVSAVAAGDGTVDLFLNHLVPYYRRAP